MIKAAQFDISPSDFSRNALNVVEKLQRQGFEAYIVGGCIRDLLLGKNQKILMLQQMLAQSKSKTFFNANVV